MKHLNQADKMLVESFDGRLKDVDSIAAESVLTELEKSEPYLNPSHENHLAYLVVRSQIIARQIELSGRNPHESGNDANSSMLDNQRFHNDNQESIGTLDFTADDAQFEVSRQNASNYLQDLQAGKIAGVAQDERPEFIRAAQKQLIDMDVEQADFIKSREAELERIEEWELSQDAEQATRHSVQRKQFFESRLRNVFDGDREAVQALAEQEWDRLQHDFGG